MEIPLHFPPPVDVLRGIEIPVESARDHKFPWIAAGNGAVAIRTRRHPPRKNPGVSPATCPTEGSCMRVRAAVSGTSRLQVVVVGQHRNPALIKQPMCVLARGN